MNKQVINKLKMIQETIKKIEGKGGTVTSKDITKALDDIRKGLLDGTVKLNKPK